MTGIRVELGIAIGYKRLDPINILKLCSPSSSFVTGFSFLFSADTWSTDGLVRFKSALHAWP
jgi:hypothetical protein